MDSCRYSENTIKGGMTRRDFLAAGGATVAGLLAAAPTGRLARSLAREPSDLLFVSNAGDKSLAVVQGDTPLGKLPAEAVLFFPANGPSPPGNVIWTGLDGGVAGLDAQTGRIVARVETGSAQNYVQLTPDGHHLIVAARYTDAYLRIDADPASPTFGQVTARFDIYANAGPCDVTVERSGRYAYTPDRRSDAVSVLDLDAFRVIRTVSVEPLVGNRPDPFMATVSPDGRWLLVENTEGGGTESIFALQDPTDPREVVRLTAEDGLGRNPLTSEFRPDGRFGYVICRDSNELTVIDLEALEVAGSVRFPAGSNPVSGAVSTNGTRLYVPLPGRDAVAIVDLEANELAGLIPSGPVPLHAVVLRTTVPAGLDRSGLLPGVLPVARTFPEGCPYFCCGEIV
ncbi:hypothetical protein LIP_3362 [Limnochorda pilosa]|uniref:Uncharacterized protein n=2 Tax=Limnochorda pilosa TaxID=1555112 RepID=A0A0K2SQU6_LIMPI|nr:hypothetical protein LIP_3362 [Limnochorda pilosa]